MPAALLFVLAGLGAQDPDAIFNAVDFFHPTAREGGEERPEPALGGSVSIHLVAMPTGLNLTLDNTVYARRIMEELHETLLARDWEDLSIRPNLCSSYVEEDMVVLRQPPPPQVAAAATTVGQERVVFGRVESYEGGHRVTPVSGGNPLSGPVRLAETEVERVERGCVFTFALREGVEWHDGHVFDAGDVRFSWDVYRNPDVRCERTRFQFQKLVRCDVLGELAVRFFYEQQYFKAVDAFCRLCILPAHLYDLLDPDCPDFDPQATPAERARYVNDNPHNVDWVGLGPYELSEWTSQAIVARRTGRYFDARRSGWIDEIRWRHVADDGAARVALLNGELDFSDRLAPEDYFGEFSARPEFEERLYEGYFYEGRYGFIAWNLRRPQLEDVRVRQALARCFDFEEFNDAYYRGLAVQVTGPQHRFGPAYDTTVAPYAFDPSEAERLLTEAGWYDRDGDGLRDRQGANLEIELLMPAGNDAGTRLALRLQESLAEVGVRLTIATRDLASVLGRVRERDFDACCLAWTQAPESDPEQKWHSRWAESAGSSNLTGLHDAQVDELIEAGQRELGPSRRHAIWRELHARLYELQPYLFLFNSPTMFALDRSIRGFQIVRGDPHYVVRRWYYPAGTPGTRPRPPD